MGEFKVALVSEEFPPFTFGGIGAACHDLAHALSRNGVSTTVFCGKANKPTTDRINENLSIVRLPCFDMAPRFLWFQLQNLKSFLRLFRRYSVLHIVNPEAGAITAYAARYLKLPIVTSIHGVYLYALGKSVNSPFSDWALKDLGYKFFGFPLNDISMQICLKLSNRIAVCSASTLAELEALYPSLDLRKVSVIPNGIDFGSMPRGCIGGNSVQDHSIICYGRLFWTKGVQYLLEAVANLKEEFPDINLQVFGDGPFRNRIDGLVLKLNIGDHVEVNAKIPRTELWKKIQRAAVVVLPSLQEAQPIGVLEAMALRKAVIAFDYPFSREIITNLNNGLLARPADSADLTKMIRLLLKDETLRRNLGKNAYDFVERKHNWDSLAARYIELYEDIT